MNSRIEEYKLLIDIYYKEVNLSYIKATIFITIQLGVLSGVIAAYDMLKNNRTLFLIGLFL